VSLAIRRYEPGDADEWDAFAARSRSGHFLFQRGYMDYHSDRFEDHSLLVREDERLVALLPANRDGASVASHDGLTFGGFLTDDAMSTRRMLAVFEAVLDHLRADGVEAWLYKAVPHIYHRVPAEEDLYALFRAGARLVRRDAASAIRLDARVPYAKGRRAAVKAAARAGVRIARSDDFEGFMTLQGAVLRSRYGVDPVHTADELALLAGRFPDSIALHVATVDDRLVAGIVLYETAVVAHCQYIAANDEGREAHALDLLADTLIESCTGRRRWWDFGASTERSGRHLNEQLIRNKESYGARAVVYDHYLLELTARAPAAIR
jgi:hypothetical protein